MAETTATLKDCKPGAYIMVDGEPCKVMDFAKFKTGKHGTAKARLTVMGIFDGKKRDVLLPADTQVQVPIIEKKKGQVITLTGELAQLMDLTDYSTFDSAIPEEFKGKLEAGMEVEYWRLGNRTIIKAMKSGA